MTTVRSQEKADKIRVAHPNVPNSQLDFVIVKDIAQEDAFDKAVISDPPFEAVIHTASPVSRFDYGDGRFCSVLISASFTSISRTLRRTCSILVSIVEFGERAQNDLVAET